MLTGTELPGLDSVSIDRLAASWSDGGLWQDVQWLAQRFWNADGTDRLVAWHHLVMAVGNFKRQRGRRLRPAPLGFEVGADLSRSAFDIPEASPSVVVASEDHESWPALEKALPGAAVATTTTLMAALWGHRHFVFDWRVHAAANALRLSGRLEPTNGLSADRTGAAPISFDDYRTIRPWVLSTAKATRRPVADIERSLYTLSQRTPAVKGRTWGEYADEVSAVLARVSESRT